MHFVARNGHLFLPLYAFNLETSEWSHREFPDVELELDLEQDYSGRSLELPQLPELRKSYLVMANNLSEKLSAKAGSSFKKDRGDIEELKYFYYLV